MNGSFGKARAWLGRRAENFAAALLAVMFLAFMVQIVFRYLLNFPIGWTSELTIITWLWLVLWGAAFVLKENEEIRFDLIYSGVGPRVRRVMGIITAVAILILYAGSLPATVDYVQFMHVEKTAYIKIPFNWLYSIYILFAVAVIARYAWILSRLLRSQDAVVSDDSPAVSSGL
jgi:TRAP-type C4-dicarboxylate transport system permease small subunit